jgi:hypothetical protein
MHMKKGFYRATHKVINLLEEKIEAEKSWLDQEGYALSSARMMNVLRDIIGEISMLEDIMEEENRIFKLKIKGE